MGRTKSILSAMDTVLESSHCAEFHRVASSWAGDLGVSKSWVRTAGVSGVNEGNHEITKAHKALGSDSCFRGSAVSISPEKVQEILNHPCCESPNVLTVEVVEVDVMELAISKSFLYRGGRFTEE